MTTPIKDLAIAALWCSLLVSVPSRAGEFSVNPIRLELGVSVKSGVIAVKNEDKQKLSFQLQAMEWTQSADGKDQYADTPDLLFFPKILSIEPGEEGLIRVGTKTPVVVTEKTYRLFIEELPDGSKRPEGSAAQINVLIRFGAPVFVTPPKPQDSLDIESFHLTKGVVTIAAKNTGNRHQLVQGVDLRGTDSAGQQVYALTLADRYLLAGTAKSYTTFITSEQCVKISSLVLEFKTDKVSASRKLDISRTLCP